MYFEYHRASTRHLHSMNVLIFACTCDHVCMRHRSREINYVWIIYKCMFVFATKKSVHLKKILEVYYCFGVTC